MARQTGFKAVTSEPFVILFAHNILPGGNWRRIGLIPVFLCFDGEHLIVTENKIGKLSQHRKGPV